jgi:hypothetical protein
MESLIQKAYAAINVTSLTPTNSTGNASITSLVGTVLMYLSYFAGALAVGYLIYSGILYITAAGNPDAAKKGQQGIINAIIGIVIIVLALVIINVVTNSATNIGTGSTQLP